MVTSVSGRLRVVVRGVVQGVGFRPFVYRLAREHGLGGWVLNSTEGVVIEVEGTAVASFLRDLTASPPPLAKVERVEVTQLPPMGYTTFSIHDSEDSEGAVALVSPDISLCDDCLRELFDPADRRYRYPFINCTNCGPRFTIVEDIPYDRPKTTMRAFPMCPRCQAEYENPENRRFHAQPNACPECGPRVQLVCAGGKATGDAAIRRARALLRAGRIVAAKGLGGFHLACDAGSEAAVAELRRRKGRAGKPFAVMAVDAVAAARLCEVSDDERRLLMSPQRPIVLLRRRPDSPVAPSVAPRNGWLGVMLPYTPLHHLLLEGQMPPLVMTSGNLSEEPIAIGNEEARERLGSVADAFLWHNRDIHVRCDDSVTRVVAGRETLIRRSRGYAPFPVRIDNLNRQVLACGAELKNTFCLTRDGYAFLSGHIGDLENWETLRSFEEGIAHFQRLFRVAPEALAHDLHPDYLSTKYALGPAGEGKRVLGVQHHHAHIASCLAENGLRGQVIGVALDGTGYGPDGAIWGGEFLAADEARYDRVGHLAYVPLPGGAAAIRLPYRTALSFAAAAGEYETALALLRGHLEREKGSSHLTEAEANVLRRQVQGNLNSPATSSCGRLFDAVSALAGVRQVVTYEGQAAIELEMASDPTVSDEYPLPVVDGPNGFLLDHRPLLRAVVTDVAAGAPASLVSARFHNALAASIGAACRRVRAERGLIRVALSGGVFQNTLLLARTVARLRDDGFAVYTQHQVPGNDGGIALGQTVIANALLEQ